MPHKSLHNAIYGSKPFNHSPGHGGSAGEMPDGGGGALDGRFGAMSNPGGGCIANGIFSPCDMAFPSTSFWGTQMADLPGFGTNWGSYAGLGLWDYERRLANTRKELYEKRYERSPPKTDPKEYVPQNPKTVPFFSSDELRDEFKKLLSNKDCGGLVSALIRETESGMRDSQRLDLGSDPLNFEDLFENIAGQGGYVLVDGLNLNGTAINATVAGGIWTGDAQAQIRTRGYFTNGPPKQVASSLYDNRRNYLASAFHETFHHLDKFGYGATDEALGRAAFKITGDTQGLPGENGTVLQWSSYFNEQLMQKCMPDQRTNKRN